ncbi:MAG: hypothetical protein ABH876_01375 [Patescibacteria group bacterium]
MKKAIILITILFLFIAVSVQAQGGSLFLSPGSGSFIVEDTFPVEVEIDTAGISINAVQVTIYFPSEELEVLNISKDSSIFTLWPKEPEFSNFSGEISFSVGTPHPGFSGIGNIITINFKAKKEGLASLVFGDGQVLANDGKGTNILVFLKEAKYFIQKLESPADVKIEARLDQAPLPPQIICLTHPQKKEWYNNNNPLFQWEVSPDVTGVSFILDRDPNTIPDTNSEGKIQSKIYENIDDGIWYFHIRLENEMGWSEPAYYKIQVDASFPYPLEIIIDNAGDSTNPRPNLYFETNDDASGISYYKFKIGEENFLDLMLAQINPFPLPFHSPGHYSVIVRAMDEAGNGVESKAMIDVKPIENPQITIWPEIYVSGEKMFYIEGTALPEVEITIFLKKDGKVIKKWQTLSDSQGEWSFFTRDLIKSGTYYLSAQAKDKRGAVSEVTTPKTMEISLSGLALGPILITFKSLVLIFALISILGILIFGFLIFRIRQSKKILKKETKEVKESVQTSFEELRKEIEKRIEMLDSRPGFTDKEKKVCDELKETLKVVEESVNKEIKDVEEELK